MDIQFLGKGSGYNPGYGNTSAFFSIGDKLFLIDCGETVFEKLMSMNFEFGRYSESTIIITHFHTDHIGSLGSTLSFMQLNGSKVNVVFPNRKIVDLLNTIGITPDLYTYCSEMPAHLANLVRTQAVSVNHAPVLNCFGYTFFVGDLTFYYGGDSNAIPEEILDKFLKGEIKYIFQDTSFEKNVNKGHGSLEYLEKIIPKDLRNRVFCMHLGSNFDKTVKEKGFGIPDTEKPMDLR